MKEIVDSLFTGEILTFKKEFSQLYITLINSNTNRENTTSFPLSKLSNTDRVIDCIIFMRERNKHN